MPDERALRAGRAGRATTVAQLAAAGVPRSALRAHGLPDTDDTLVEMPAAERALLRCLVAAEPEVRPGPLRRLRRGGRP